MNSFLSTLISLSVSGSLIIILLCLIKPVIRHHITKTWQYYIWIVAVLRLLVPFSTEVNLISEASGIYANHASNQNKAPAEEVVISGEAYTSGVPVSIEYSVVNTAVSSAQQSSYIAPKDSTDSGQEHVIMDTVKGHAQILLNNLWIIWLAGAILMLFRMLCGYLRLSHAIKKSSVPVLEASTISVYSYCCGILGIKQPPPLFGSVFTKTPILTGLFRSRIVLPQCEYLDTELKYILLHELNHLKKRDLLYKWLVQVIICIHWFNPLVFLLSRQINRACELACDEAVLKALSDDQKKAYGSILINTAASSGRVRPALAISENKKDLKERLTAIMEFNKKSKFASFMSFVLLSVILSAAAFAGVWASEQVEEAPQQTLEAGTITKDWSVQTDENTFTIKQAAEWIYDKAELISTDYTDITSIILSMTDENIVIKRGGENIHLRLYTWYDGQYSISDTDGVLTVKYNENDQRYIKVNDYTYTNFRLQDVMNYLGYRVDPEAPQATNGTIVITIPEDIQLDSLNCSSMSGNLFITDISSNEIFSNTLSGSIEISDCTAANLNAGTLSGNLNADRIKSGFASFSCSSGQITLANSVFTDANISNLSGPVQISDIVGSIHGQSMTGPVFIADITGEVSANSTTGIISITGTQNSGSIKANTLSASVNIELSDPDSYRIKFNSTFGSMIIGGEIYEKNASLNANGSKELSITSLSGETEIR